MLVPGTPGVAEMRPWVWPGRGSSLVESWPGSHLSGSCRFSSQEASGLLL